MRGATLIASRWVNAPNVSSYCCFRRNSPKCPVFKPQWKLSPAVSSLQNQFKDSLYHQICKYFSTFNSDIQFIIKNKDSIMRIKSLSDNPVNINYRIYFFEVGHHIFKLLQILYFYLDVNMNIYLIRHDF